MKKSAGRKERRATAHRNRVQEGKEKMRINNGLKEGQGIRKK